MNYISNKPYWTGSKWVIDIQKNGIRKTFTSKVPRAEGKRIVKERALKWLEEGENEKNLPFFEIFERFLKFYEEKNGKNTSLERYICFGKNHIIPKIGKLPVGSITLDQFQSCISQAKPINGRTKNLSKKTLGAIRETLSAFMKWAKPRKYIDEDFSSELFIPRTAEIKGKEILQLSDIENWFSHPSGLWYEKALWFQLLTGCRPGEVLGLKISDFNRKNQILTINRSINNRGEITPGKNRNAHRQFILSGKALEIFLDQIEISRQLRSEWLFCGKFGQKPSPQKYYQTMEKIVILLGLPKISPYSLRHTFFTLCEAYLPSRSMKAIFGHSETTESHDLYGDHLIEGELLGIADKLKVTPLYKVAK